jgi:anti-anti-sigma factor
VHDDPAAPQGLTVARISDGGVPVVQAAGELDAASAAQLRAILDEVFTDGHASVEVDMAGITFIDSSGLSALIHAHKQAEARDGTLTLRSPSRIVVRLLELTGQRDRFLGA